MLEFNRYDIIKYSISKRYTRDNIVKDFIFKPREIEWFLTKFQAKREIKQYIDMIPSVFFAILEHEGWSIVITDENLEQKFGFRYDIYGVTDEENKIIYVYAHQLAVKYALAHEIGHFIDSYLGNISKTYDWKKVRESHERYPSNKELDTYYFTEKEENDKEYFANCFLLYVNDKGSLYKVNQYAYKIMKRIFENIENIFNLFCEEEVNARIANYLWYNKSKSIYRYVLIYVI